MEDFDEQQLIDFIRSHAPVAADYPDDEILNVVDMILDYYEANGLLEIDCDDPDDAMVDIDDLVSYVKRMLSRDKLSPVKPEHVEAIVRAEIEFEDTLPS